MITEKEIIEYEKLKLEKNKLDGMLKAFEERCKDELGDDELLIVGGYSIKYTKYSKKYFDKKKLEEDFKSIYEKYVYNQEERRFQITKGNKTRKFNPGF